jgi:hypothetical protein
MLGDANGHDATPDLKEICKGGVLDAEDINIGHERIYKATPQILQQKYKNLG